MGLPEIIDALVVIEERVTGVKKAFDEPPNQPESTLLPCFINLVEDGDIVTPRMSGTRQWFHRIQAIAIVALQSDLPIAEKAIRPLIKSFVEKLDADKTLGGLDGISEAAVTRYRRDPVVFRGPEGQEVQYVGVIFDVQVHEIETGVTYS